MSTARVDDIDVKTVAGFIPLQIEVISIDIELGNRFATGLDWFVVSY